MNTHLPIVQAADDDIPVLAGVLARAFHTDPVSSWLFPDAGERHDLHASFFQTFLRMALVDGEVHTTPERHAAALWLDIDPSPPEADHEVRKLLAAACRTHADRFQVLDQLL